MPGESVVKVELQKLADEIGIAILRPALPPGTRSGIRSNIGCFVIFPRLAGRPLISHEVVVNFIGHTTTNTGSHHPSELDKNASPTGMKVSSEDMKRLISRQRSSWQGLNYAIKPHQQRA